MFHYQDVNTLDKDSKNGDNLLTRYRLDPGVANNLKGWQVLRLNLIEDDKGSLKIMRAIEQMNRALIVCLIVIGYFVYKYMVVKDLYNNAMMQLSLCFLIMFYVPVFYSLNSAVETAELINEECKKKLNLLQIKQNILIQEIGGVDYTSKKYTEFLRQLWQTIRIVEDYQIKKYTIFFGIEISPKMRTYL